LEVVLARLLDLAAIDVDVVDDELALGDQSRKVEAQRGHVAGEVVDVLLEADEHTGLVELPCAVHEKAQSDERLAGARSPAYESRAPGAQPAAGDCVQA